MPHKNAEKMLEYALDAMETDEPWLSWYATNQHGDVIENLSGDIYWGSESWEYYRKKKAQPVPWDLLEDYVHKSAEPLASKALKSVDLSVLIDSGIDCFSGYDENPEHEWRQYSSLVYTKQDLEEMEVEPRMNYWFCCENFSYPFSLIRSLERAGFDVEWYDNIGGFRINGLQDGYRWPWEVSDDR